MYGNIFELYEKVKDNLKFLTASDVRAKIIISLSEGSRNLTDLKKELNLNSSTILHAMSQLEEQNIILKDAGSYFLSQIGKIAAIKLVNLVKAFASMETIESLFLNHEIESIPKSLLADIGNLNNSYIVESEPTDIMKPHAVHLDLLSKAKNVKGISSVILPQNVETLDQVLERGSLRLILTDEILDEWIKTKGKEEMKETLLKKDFELWKINGKVKLSFTITDEFLVLGLFSSNGTYDLHKYLISEDEEALEWGNRLFDYYLGHAEEVRLK